ncbi:Prephenate dehydratase [Alteracholeplasma palmae J233]|uniref:Prephenate dehydratase n=1 Tax=Alteracholeplasma palmae (strain ATCC 49389 / J233) TaxID=1318466 RepID=U4KNE7_ALTPJ|nr:prephenate dehydratase domain-containing protein [Alteracholeplasma palmae]CCV63705.1 Prephenate dehydratase [Alteracholeplasma palmae J233]
MKKMMTLGPKGTYSEIASNTFIKNLNLDVSLEFKHSIDACFSTVFDYLVVPIENSSDGFIQRTLDLLALSNAYITHDLTLPISFKLISNIPLDEVTSIYVQFKAQNQCLDILNTLGKKLIITESNTESLDKHLLDFNSAAIIPSHLLASSNYVVNAVEDYKNNETRFILIENNLNLETTSLLYKVSMCIIPFDDKPGLLSDILFLFSKEKINLSSIMSRPTKEKIGSYTFFLDFLLEKDKLESLFCELEKLKERFHYKLLGIY